MVIPPEYVALRRAGIESAPEWKEAWERATTYLDALRMPEDLERELILLSSFQRAIARKRRETVTSGTQLGFEEMQRGLDRALGYLVRDSIEVEARSVEERVRLYLTEVDSHGAFRRGDAIPRDVLEALRDVELDTTPALQPASITSKPLEFTLWGRRVKALAQHLVPAGNSRVLAWVLGLAAAILLAWSSF